MPTEAQTADKPRQLVYVHVVYIGGPCDGTVWRVPRGIGPFGDPEHPPRTSACQGDLYAYAGSPAPNHLTYKWTRHTVTDRNLHAAWAKLQRAWGADTQKALKRMAAARHRIRRAVR